MRFCSKPQVVYQFFSESSAGAKVIQFSFSPRFFDGETHPKPMVTQVTPLEEETSGHSDFRDILRLRGREAKTVQCQEAES